MLGTGPDSLVVDNLHAGSLGVYKEFCKHCTWECFRANCWDVHEPTAAGRLQTNADRVRQDLFAWYATETAAGREHSQVQALTWHMFGDEADPDMRLHAAEMNGYLHFCGSLISRFADKLERVALWRTAQASFASIDRMIKANPEVFSDANCCTFVNLAVAGLGALEDLGIQPKPKYHALVHMAGDVYEKGSPARWACWVDEGLNKMLKDVGMGYSRIGWYERTLASANLLLGRRADAQRRKRLRGV